MAVHSQTNDLFIMLWYLFCRVFSLTSLCLYLNLLQTITKHWFSALLSSSSVRMRLFLHNDHLCIGDWWLWVKISLFFFGLLRSDQLCYGCRVFDLIELIYWLFGFLEFCLFFSFFFLTLQELIGGLVGNKKIDMQDYQISQQEGKNGHSSSNNPR